jgi:hypothetical protein
VDAEMLFKRLRQLFVVTLPLTALPIITACISGVLFSIWDHRNVQLITEHFMLEVKDLYQDWGLPGVPTRRQYHDTNNNFHITRVGALDWFRKLGFLLPQEYMNFEESFEATPIDKYADLEHLMRDPNRTFAEPFNAHSWLYLTDEARPSSNEWDAAFDAVLQKCYKQSCGVVGFVNCNTTGAYLCGVWKTRAPALVHFHDEPGPVSEDDVGSGLSYDAELEDLHRITARIIEFPLEEAFIGTSLLTLPSPTEQMLAVMTREDFYEQFPPFSLGEQMLNKRFNEYMDTFWQDKHSVLHQISNLDDWMWDNCIRPLGLKIPAQVVYLAVFSLAALPGKTVLETWKVVDFLWGEFTGRVRPGDAMMADADDVALKPGYFEGLVDEVWTASMSRKSVSESISMSKDLESLFAQWATSSMQAEPTPQEVPTSPEDDAHD